MRLANLGMPTALALWTATLGGCGHETATARREPTTHWTLRQSAVWVGQESAPTGSGSATGKPGLPASVYAVGWGDRHELWVSGDEVLGRMTDAVTGREIELVAPLEPGAPGLPEHSVLDPRGAGGRLAYGTDEGLVVVVPSDDRRAAKALAALPSPERAGLMALVRWTPQGRLAVHVHLACDVAVLDPDTGKDIWRRTDPVARYPACSPDGRWLLLPWAEGPSAAELIEADTGKVLAKLPNHDQSRVYGAVDSKGQWAVMGRYGPVLTVWEVATGKATSVAMQSPTRPLPEEPEARPISIAFLPESSICVVASPGSVSLLDVNERRWLARWEPDRGPLAEYVPQSDLAVSADGRFIAVRTSAPAVHVLEIVRTSE